MKLELQPGAPVSIMVLSQIGQAGQPAAEAQILAISGRRMTLASEVTAPAGTAVQIQSPEYVVLAEVLSFQAGSGTLVLQIRHVLRTGEIDYIRQQWT